MGVRVGSDVLRYEVQEGWGSLPKGFRWGQVASVGGDAEDRVHFFTRTEHPVIMFERDGRFLGSFGEGLVRDPHGFCLDSSGNRYCVDRTGQVLVKYTATGTKLLEVGSRDQPSDTGWTPEGKFGKVLRGAGPFNYPTDVALSADGSFYVSDGYRNARVHKFAPDGTHLFSWGEPGTGPGQFNLVHSVWEHDGKVYVADRENHRVQIFSPEGEFLAEWRGFVQPADIYVDDRGVVYIAELAGRVTLLDLTGQVLARIGSPDARGAQPGHFISPHGIWADRHGDFYVSEVTTGQRVQKFVRL